MEKLKALTAGTLFQSAIKPKGVVRFLETACRSKEPWKNHVNQHHVNGISFV
jgi:hypothetical protein